MGWRVVAVAFFLFVSGVLNLLIGFGCAIFAAFALFGHAAAPPRWLVWAVIALFLIDLSGWYFDSVERILGAAQRGNHLRNVKAVYDALRGKDGAGS
jgi:hypothetical protein